MGFFDLFKKKKQLHLYPEEAQEQYEAFVEQQFGESSGVLHELVSPDIHLDIIVIPPTEEQPYYKLVTMGMGAYKMNIPRELQHLELERAELVLYLPPNWDLNSGREEDFWPIKQLKTLGRLPVSCNTWLCSSHTVSSDRQNTPYAGNTKFCSMMLVNAMNKDRKKPDLRIDGLGKINFYLLFPLYREELEYKQKTDMKALLQRFDPDDLLPVLNNDRRNYGIV